MGTCKCKLCEYELAEYARAKYESKEFKDGRVFNVIPLHDTPIYRIFHKKYLYDIISKKRNVLTNFLKWDDPFEGYLFKQKVWHNGCRVLLDEQLKDYYGQCWSLKKKETDARWRIYSPDKHGILVKSTFGQLWDSFYGNCEFYNYDKSERTWCDHSIIACAIGRVEYLEDEEIVKEFQSMAVEEWLNSSGSNSMKSLLIKRIEFEHEKEIRIIYDGFERKCLRKKGLMSYPIDDPNKLFCKKLIADPRMPESCFKLLKLQFKARNFNLERSKIYEVPEVNMDFKAPT